MNIFDDDGLKPAKAVEIVVGQDLSKLSEKDLTERISSLEAEIERTRDTLKHRGSVRSAADALFSKP
ncbi:DUF1192 domain-containing protein [Roseibium sp. RKSG952]|uniref:DUF1192 domain-containing protein n=1 Tax=Roseibium sp. RKSG952 TaxID=2529384 RepID=UPI0012BC8833|nr:DUF1192 domain-containing protein [Roseibium sp. RKSG952]MTI00157.1 DUF1192 domain-containing protein [Roseibium sp. RKSG952]